MPSVAQTLADHIARSLDRAVAMAVPRPELRRILVSPNRPAWLKRWILKDLCHISVRGVPGPIASGFDVAREGVTIFRIRVHGPVDRGGGLNYEVSCDYAAVPSAPYLDFGAGDQPSPEEPPINA